MRVLDLTRGETEDVCIQRIILTSGIRPARRTVDNSENGRSRHGILYIWEGAVSFTLLDDSVVSATSGDLVIIPKGSRYTMRYEAESTTFVLMNCQLTLDDGQEVALTDGISVVANDLADRRIAAIMAKLEMCSASENNTAMFRRKELAYRLFSMVFDDRVVQELSQARYPAIVPGVLLLQKSYLENIPITKLAQVCGISVSSFRRQFGEAFGLSPVQYRNRLRLRRARQLLEDGNCTVTEAAFASGFENLGYFCRSYKKLTGQTPYSTKAMK